MKRCVIVVPCYNEAVRIDLKRFSRFTEKQGEIGFVMVNDGSTDRTLDLLRQLEETGGGSFRVLDLPQNGGKAEAVRLGMLEALGSGAEFVGYWDADLATPLEQIPVFLAAMEEEPAVHLILGSRVRLLGHQIDRHLARHLLGRVFATAASLVLRLPVYDTQCGAKLFRAGADVDRVFAAPFHSGWVFDVEMLARWCGMEGASGRESIREFPLRSWQDVAGSKVRPIDFVRSFFELAAIAWRYGPVATAANRRSATLAMHEPGSRQPGSSLARRGAQQRSAPLRKTA
jgi:dolichyl-phosphate beta-glucosyltransferase